MPNTIVRDERTYRRGMVMGLTLAEVMLLVLFALLLILGWTVRQQQADSIILNVLRPLLPSNVRQGLAGPNEIGDAVQELKASADVGKTVLAALVPGNGSMSPRDLSRAEARARELIELGKTAETAFGPNATGADPATAAREALKTAETEYRKARTALGHGSARIWLEGLIKNQVTQDGSGSGLVFPSCVPEVDGRAPYVFDVTLNSDSLVVRDNTVPAMQKWSAQVAYIHFDTVASDAQFDAMTAPLFEWSRTNQCRFFVRVFDSTKPDEKAVYKAKLQTVENHFYKYLVDVYGR